MEAYNSLKRNKKFARDRPRLFRRPFGEEQWRQHRLYHGLYPSLRVGEPGVLDTAGSVLKTLRSKGGYHIFKNEGERKALGRVKVAQILLAYPPGATEAVQASVRQKADSIYTLLARGGDFAALARTNSGDNLSYQTGGELPEFGVGKYDSAFEAAVYGLAEKVRSAGRSPAFMATISSSSSNGNLFRRPIMKRRLPC